MYQVLVRAGREDQAMMTTFSMSCNCINISYKRNKYIIYYSKDYVWFIGKTFIKNLNINFKEFRIFLYARRVMDIIKIIGVGLIALIIIIIVKQYRPEFTMYVSVAAGIIILLLVMDKLSAIINLLTNLANRTSINNEFIFLLIKITGIAILTEFASSVCKDSGETAIASKVDMGGKIIIIAMSIPIIASLLETILKVLP